MPVVHGSSGRVLLGKYDLSAYARDISIDANIDTHDATAFLSGTSRVKKSGLKHATVSGSAFFDDAVNASHDILSAAFAGGPSAASDTLSIFPSGYGELSNRALIITSRENTFQTSVISEDLVMISFGMEATSGAVESGLVLLPFAAYTATGNGTSIDNTASSANGLVSHLHVTATAGASPSTVVKIQHSADNSVWADLITFTTVTAATSQRSAVTGTVNRYLRAVRTLSGDTTSLTACVAIARR